MEKAEEKQKDLHVRPQTNKKHAKNGKEK